MPDLPSWHSVVVLLHLASIVVGAYSLLVSVESITFGLVVLLRMMFLRKSFWLPMTDLSSRDTVVVLFHLASVVVRTHSLFIAVKSVALRMVFLGKLLISKRHFLRELFHVIVLRHGVGIPIIVISLLSHQTLKLRW